MKRKMLAELFLTFLKIGLFTFGGGYAMIPMIEDICVERKKWIAHEDMMNIAVIAESTPGPIAVNCATFVGYQNAGLAGAAAATVGVVLPSFVIIYIISMFLDHFLEIAIIASAFRGIKIAVGLLILRAGVNMLGKMKKRVLSVTIVICAAGVILLVNVFAWNFSSISLILMAAGVGLLAFTPRKEGGAL